MFIYDEMGAPIALKYRAGTYAAGTFDYFFFEKNIQGDVIAIYNASGTKIGSYTYDAWGDFTVSTIGGNTTLANNIVRKYNPFHYRGYYFDVESGFYYLQSRYYNPVWGRFLSADSSDVIAASPMGLTDKNFYAYCDNNPILRKDGGGAFWETVFDVISLAVSIVDVIQNPDDVGAWVGLAADAVDLIPFVTGVGEVTRAITTATRIAETAVAISDVSDAVDYYITPDGDAIPSTLSGFNDNLSKMENRSGKYLGQSSRGDPVRVRVEVHDPTPDFKGLKSPFHEEPHFHIERKINGSTGRWVKKFTGYLGDLL